MQNLTLEQKHQQFDEFFMIKHNIPVNMRLLAEDFVLPEIDDLHQHMPYEFQIASELSEMQRRKHLGDSSLIDGARMFTH